MSSTASDSDLDARLNDVRSEMAASFDVDAVRAMLEEMLSSMSGNVGGADPRLIAELENLVNFIEETKAEISAIRPEEIPDEHIPNVTDELDAIVIATEEATNSIMEAAELIEGVAEKAGEEFAEQLNDAATKIYEACSFQDITGQRIGKVVEALREIETKVETVVNRFGPDPATREKLKEMRRAEREAAISETPIEEMSEEYLLEGPQLPENANSQDEIDALLADLG